VAEDVRQGYGIIHLGTPTNPTLYTARMLRGPSTWQRLAIAFVATEPTVRISLLGQAASAGQTVEYDGIRFLPPGRNPVLLMAAIFARFLPHLTLDPVSVAAAAERRNEWLFSGYIPDPGRTDALLTRMSQECFCTVFKDLDGVYKITADDPDHLPVLHLHSQLDIFQESLEVQGMPTEAVYTDFYLWYQRVSTQVTASEAGQYAAVLFATPNDSISQYSELQTLCRQAADSLQTRQRFDFFCDFIADPGTADLLLARFVRQLSTVRQDLALAAALPALPLSLTDHVAVHAPLLGQQPFVGETRRYALVASASAPGLQAALTLRQSGLARGVWETWDVGGLTTFTDPTGAPGGMSMGPPGAARVRETWDEGGGEGGPVTRVFAFAAWIPALLDVITAPAVMVAAMQVRPGDTLPTTAPLWQASSLTPAETTPWTPVATVTGGGQGTALGSFEIGDRLYAAIRATTSTPPVTLWRLGLVSGQTTEQQGAFPDATLITSTLEHGSVLLLGTATGDIYAWESGGSPALVLSMGGGRVQNLWVLSGGIIEAWIESPGGLIVMRATDPAGPWTPYVYAGLTGTRCSAGIVRYIEDIWAVATGTEAGGRVDIWNLAFAGEATLMHTFLGGPGSGVPFHRPGPLCIGPVGWSEAHPYIYVGRVSLETTPLLELWGFDYTQGAVAGWQLLMDYATVPDATHGLDTNQGITALRVSLTSQKLYVATGTPGGSSAFPGARLYDFSPT